MKKIGLLLVLSFSILHFPFSILECQTWKELMDSTKFYREKQDFETALQWIKLALPEAEKEFGKNDTNYISTLGSFSALFYHSGNLDSAIKYQEIQLKLSRLIYKSDNPKLATSINNLAYFFDIAGNYDAAEPLFKESLAISRRLSKGDNNDLATNINNAAIFYDDIGNYAEAEPLYKESLDMRRRLFKNDNSDLASSINNMASYYDRRGNYNAAESLYKEALAMYRRLYKNENSDLAAIINNLAGFYFEIGNYIAAESLYKESFEMCKRLFKGDNPDLAAIMSNIARFYIGNGNYAAVEPLLKQALEMKRRLFKGDNPDLATSINNMAYFYDIIGNYAAAEPLYKEALEMSRRLFKGDHPDLATSINNMAMFYDDIGNYAAAESLYKEALDMRRRLFKDIHPDLASSINNMASFVDRRGNYKAAEPLYMEALDMYRRLYKSDNPDLVASIDNLAGFYAMRGNFPAAEPLYKEAFDMSRRLFKSDNPYLASAINHIADFYEEKGNYTEAEPFQIEALKVYSGILSNFFPSLSEKEKKKFWKTMSGNFEAFNTFAINRADENPTILCNMYDNQLATKAMLFNSEKNIKERIMSSRDSTLIEKYKRWKDLHEFLVKLYKMTNDEFKMKNFNIDSIENMANNLEKEISIKSEPFAKSYEKKKLSWIMLHDLLKPDEAAVEVVRFRYHEKFRFTDTIYYAFLIVNNRTKDHPDLILLKDGKQLENEYYNDYRNFIREKIKDTVSYGRFWGKLNEKIKNYKKIYFSADGIYNKLNPSTLLMPNGRYLLDLQDIQQMNSTKDIILGALKTNKENYIGNNAVLIGNPNFSLPEDKVLAANRRIRGENPDEKSYEQLTGTRGIGLTKLPGTEKEVKNIEKFLKSKKWDVKTYLGDSAVKEAVLSVNSPRVLHIATHGLFLEDIKSRDKTLLGFEEQKMIDNPLLRSGLFFTGADNYVNRNDITASDDKGMLTAYEAMNLNLDKTELVVLSACETGLGEIQNGEGVYGLRRAFQQAGAKTVLMSLWRVNDEATQELMSDFYQNWVSGMTKREAFSKAQQEVRSKYKDPYFWGAFVMVGE